MRTCFWRASAPSISWRDSVRLDWWWSDPCSGTCISDGPRRDSTEGGGMGAMATDVDDGWPTTEELKLYAAHGPVLEQATAFLTHITTTITLYATVTGAAWMV